ncbi:retrovirus-related Pol polyprotein from transposon 297 [Trichonephila clavipes]|nr:retrovirus-related Pol polyprotein from transposon 297 [Trichonephila clavipes]
MEIAEIVAKEPLEKRRLPPPKNLLLARFQLTPIALRDRFESHQRRPGAMWADLVFELRSYLDNFLAGMKVGDFAALKELLVTEQIKKRAPSELVDHFLDSWDGFKEAKSLAEKLDHFEAIRRVHKKTGPTKTGERRTFDKQPLESKNKSAHFSGKGKNIGPLNRDPYKYKGGEDDSFIIPAFEGEGGKSSAKVNSVEFKEEQRKCPDLKPLWDKALTGIDKEFRVIRRKLVRVAKTKRGEESATPQSNAVERVHRTIKRVIKALCVESGEDWEGVLPLALFSLRTVAHESTGFSPTELVMGKNLRTPQTLVYEEWMEVGNTSQSVVEYILQLNNRLKGCQDIAITRMKECQLKRKTWYDRDAVERKFVEGDLVMVLATSKQNKLEVNWIGPGKVLSRISDTNYAIDLPRRRDRARSTIYHVNLLKPYDRRPELIDELKQVITKNKDMFSPDPGTTHLMRMDIELISDKPIKTKPYRMSPRQINIFPNKDPRPFVDYRRLNEITRAEFFPLPNMEEIVEKVSAAPYVTVMDLSKGYFQIPLTPRAQRYAAFVTPFGTYIPKKMMFGLVCAPYYF